MPRNRRKIITRLNFSKLTSNKSTQGKFKLKWPYFLVSVLFIFLILYSFNLEIISSTQYLYKSSNLNIRQETIQPARGIIYDSDGNSLVRNIQSLDLYIKKKDYTDEELNALSLTISQRINIDQKQILSEIVKINDSKYDVKVLSNLTSEQAFNLQNDQEDLNDLYFDNSFKRQYLNPVTFAHIIGYTGTVTEDDLGNGYESNDQIGKYKLELQLEDQLKGTKGKMVSIGGIQTQEDSIPGDNVYLTIKTDWQNALYDILGEEVEYFGAAGGGGAIVDDSNGNVVALVSYPGFDSNLFVQGIDSATYEGYLTDREKPLVDKALSFQAAPGSSFKLITAYTLLENNIIDENTTYYSNRCINLGTSNFCEYGQLFYGQMDVTRALYKSSNLFFCTNLLNLYHDNELQKFVDAANLFNIGHKTGINLLGEIDGNMDSPEYRKATLGLDWYEGDTCNAAIGQGAVVVTPIQMAMVASTIANSGVYYQPNIIDKITDPFGNIIQKNDPIIEKRIPISQKTLDLINEGLHDVAYYPDGTVYQFLHDVPGNIRAKTGTAEAYETLDGQEVYRTHGWIVGSFDHQGKTYSFAFYMNYGGGGYYIGKVLRKFVNCVYSDFENGCKAW